jgi:hypothetical protein
MTDRRQPPLIEPVGRDDRPYWSVMIPTHEGEELLAETLASVLRQDLGPQQMQIEVVDDHSSRIDTEAVVRRIAGDRVSWHRQETNVGHTANFNTCLHRAEGHVVHLLHDDDVVRPGFYRTLQGVLRARPDVGVAMTRHIFADGGGQWRSLSPIERRSPGLLDGWLPRIASGMRTTAPAVVMRRSVYETVGGFDPRVRGGEDWEMYVRAATRFAWWYEPEPLAVYRYARPGSLTADAVGTTTLVDDMLRAADIVESYLPDHLPREQAARVLAEARRIYGRWSLEGVPQLVRAGEWRAAGASLQVGMTAGPPLTMIRTLLGVLLESSSRQLLGQRG